MSSLERQKDVVKHSLKTFLDRHIGGTPLSCIDDIVLSYVTSILEDLGLQVNCGEHFDAEEFIEIMGAYFPGFTDIESSEVCDWLFGLTKQMSADKFSVAPPLTAPTSTSPPPTRPPFVLEIPRPLKSCSSTSSSSSSSSSPALPQPFIQLYLSSEISKHSAANDGVSCLEKSDSSERSTFVGCHKKLHANERRQHRSLSSEKDDEDEDAEDDEIDKRVELLREMFPNVRLLEVTQCLSIAGGDTERAAQLIMHRIETTEGFALVPLQSVKFRNRHQDDKELKQHILSRYAYVDQAEDAKEHKPVTPKTEPKKLIRYRDNKIVSLKGEKYTEVKKDDDEGEGVKKAVAPQCVKPARQYRFH